MEINHSVPTDDDAIQRLETYLLENVTAHITLTDVCRYMKMSRTHLVTLFKRKKDTGTMEFYKNLKIEQAKALIREDSSNITEIAEILGYNSIHSFSRHFKNVTGLSPIEYSKTVKSRF